MSRPALRGWSGRRSVSVFFLMLPLLWLPKGTGSDLMRRTFTSAVPFAACLCLLVAGTSAPGAAQSPFAPLPPQVSIYAGRTGTNAEGIAREFNTAFLDARGILVRKDLPALPGAGGISINGSSGNFGICP